MPELPEVQTTVNGLNDEVKGLTITDVWSDYRSHFHAGKKNVHNPDYFAEFKREVVGARIVRAARQGKNVLIHLSNGRTILVHMKMTGHFLYGKYKFDGKTWKPAVSGSPLSDPFNRFIHLVLSLSGGCQLAFSDMRKFGKIFVFETENERKIEDLMHLGPDPLTREFTFGEFKKRLGLRHGGKIKQVLMDQEIISGIGNIYSDEILWKAGVHPFSSVGKIPDAALREIFKFTKAILKRGIDFGGDSMSDYRNVYGERGEFQNKHEVYRRTGERCGRRHCGGVIHRAKIGGRSAHFCNKHQKLYH